MSRLGVLLRAARGRAGLTQGALAAACGLSRQTIAQLEAGSFSDLGIRKVERVLEQLALRLYLAPTRAEDTAPRAGTRLESLFRARGEARRATAMRLAQAALRQLHKEGVSARIVGSLAKGTFRADSDVDFLIEDHGGQTLSRIIGLIEASMAGFPFDVIGAKRTDRKLLEFTRSEAKRGASAVRAS